MNGVTSMIDGRVLIAPYRMRTALGFANTWYHEAIHSSHVISGAYNMWVKRFGDVEALRISEFYAHSLTDQMSGVSMNHSHAFGRYFPTLYFQSIIFPILNR